MEDQRKKGFHTVSKKCCPCWLKQEKAEWTKRKIRRVWGYQWGNKKWAKWSKRKASRQAARATTHPAFTDLKLVPMVIWDSVFIWTATTATHGFFRRPCEHYMKDNLQKIIRYTNHKTEKDSRNHLTLALYYFNEEN